MTYHMEWFEFISLVACVIIAYITGYIFTETRYYLARYPMFRFKAFECRPCLSFHICWVLTTTISLLYHNYLMVVIGVIFSFILFFGLYNDMKKRFIP